MTNPPEHLPAFHESAIAPLLTDVRPVARTWPLAHRFACWAALALGSVCGWLAAHDAPIAHRIGDGLVLAEASLAALAALALAWLTLRTAVPGRLTARHSCLAIAPFAGVVMLALTRPPDVASFPLVAASTPQCTLQILGVALIPGIALALAVFRGEPLRSSVTLAAAGGAALLIGAAAVTLICPIDVRSHVLVAHLSPSVLAIVIGAGVGAWRPRS